MIAKLERTLSNAYKTRTNTVPLQSMGATIILWYCADL